MSYFSQKLFLRTSSPIIQFQRFRGKINIQRPRQPHYERARVIAVTQPIYPEKQKTMDCFKKRSDLHLSAIKQPEENPYNKIIAREVLNWLNHSKMVGIYHINSISSDDLFKIRVQLHKENMHLKSYGKNIIKLAVEDTKYEAILPLFDSNHCIIFSPNQQVAKLLKLTKKVTQMILIGGIVENTLMSRNQFIEYSKLPDLQTMRSQFVNVLNMASGQLVNNLEAHQKALVNILDVYAKDENTSSVDEKEADSITSATPEIVDSVTTAENSNEEKPKE